MEGLHVKLGRRELELRGRFLRKLSYILDDDFRSDYRRYRRYSTALYIESQRMVIMSVHLRHKGMFTYDNSSCLSFSGGKTLTDIKADVTCLRCLRRIQDGAQ